MRFALPISAGLVAVAGGVFFGLFSCGGYLWHRHVFWILLALPVIGATALPPTLLRPWPRRLAFVVSILAAFVTTRAVVSAFYPVAPTSWAEFAHAVWSGLVDGPC
jgi:hypothetical protein